MFQKTLDLRDPPALATTATIFMGQIEEPIFIRAYLNKLNHSKLFMLITIDITYMSDSTIITYTTILTNILPNAAAHVLTTSIISTPTDMLLAQIIMPSNPMKKNTNLDLSTKDKTYNNSINAMMKGTTNNLQITLNVGATLIIFVTLATMINKVLNAFPPMDSEPLSIARSLNIVFTPLT